MIQMITAIMLQTGLGTSSMIEDSAACDVPVALHAAEIWSLPCLGLLT